MSDKPLPNVRSSGIEIADETIQRAWDRFAMLDHSVDPESHNSTPAPSSSNSVTETFAKKAFDSLMAYDSTTAVGDTFATAESSDRAVEDTYAPDDGGTL